MTRTRRRRVPRIMQRIQAMEKMPGTGAGTELVSEEEKGSLVFREGH
jgi:hypothetical protein